MTETPESLPEAEGALAGTRVIDLTRVLGGPFCTMILADHGATVIKVEPPQGDETRDWGPPFHRNEDGTEDASYFLGVNRGKRSLALDLARPEGRDVLLRLLEQADVLVENFKPGTLEKWGLGYEANLRPCFPGLVHCRISGFGADGPYGGFPGYDAILQAMVGLMSVNGDERTGPLRLGTPMVDLGTGLFSAVGILMALLERARSGQGQFLDMTLHDCGMALLHPQGANYLLSGTRPRPTGNRHPNLAPYDVYETRTGPIFVGVGNDRAFARLVAALGDPGLAQDPRFARNRDRMANRDALTAALAALFAPTDGEALSLALLAEGVPAGPVRSIDQVVDAPHTKARRMLAGEGHARAIATPVKFGRSVPPAPRPPPGFGADGRAVLEAHGFTDLEIEALERAGVLLAHRRGAGAAP